MLSHIFTYILKKKVKLIEIENRKVDARAGGGEIGKTGRDW